MSGKPRPTRYRDRGKGTVFQRCERQYGCPDAEKVTDEDGKTRRVRPKHRCRGVWIAQLPPRYRGGKLYRPAVSAKSKQRAMEKLAELEEQERTNPGRRIVTKTPKTEAWLDHWIQHVCTVGPGTWPTYKGIVNNHLIPHLGPIPLRDLGIDDLKAMYAAMDKDGAIGARPQTHRVLRKALADAIAEGYITSNPARMIPSPAGKGGTRQHHTVADVKKILAAAAGNRLESRWRMAVSTGKRQGECLGLEWDRVDLDLGVVDVQWQLQRLSFEHGCTEDEPCGKKRGGHCPARTLRIPDGYEHRVLEDGLVLTRPKTQASEQPIPLPPALWAAFKRRRKLYEQERAEYLVDHGLVHPRPDGRPANPTADLADWKQLEESAGVPVLDLHAGGRHTLATHLLELGISDHVSQEILGHTEAATTRGYQHADLTLARDALSRAEQRLL